jgi:hypothetical protein
MHTVTNAIKGTISGFMATNATTSEAHNCQIKLQRERLSLNWL